MIAVVDASVAAKALSTEQVPLLVGDLARYHLAFTVSHFDAEVGSALRGLWLGRLLSRESFRSMALLLPDLPINRVPTDTLLGRIVDLADNATFYDAAYIALAEALDADLLTADKRLTAVPNIRCNIVVR